MSQAHLSICQSDSSQVLHRFAISPISEDELVYAPWISVFVPGPAYSSIFLVDGDGRILQFSNVDSSGQRQTAESGSNCNDLQWS